MSDQRLGIEGFTEEERKEILNQIEEISKKSAISVTNEAFDFVPQKRGALFPILINILAVLTIAGVFFYANRVFQARSEALSAEAQSYLSTEGKLLEELKKESNRKLGEKEEEIGKIQNELARIDQEKEALESNMEERIKEKEEELQGALEAAIAEERVRLQAMGTSAEELESQLESFRAEQEAAYQREVEAFRQESRAALEAKQQELEEAKALAEDILNQANREREELIQESQQREEELRAGFDEQRESLQTETAEARAQLQSLAQARQNEQLFLDQLTAGYNAILEAINNNDRARAESDLSAFRTLLHSDTANALDSARKRRPIDTYLAELLEDRIATIGGGSDQTLDTGLLDSARLLLAARKATQKGDEAFQEERVNDAAASWSKALELLPTIKSAAESLGKVREDARAERSGEYLSLAAESLEAGEREEARERLNSAILEASSGSEATRLAAADALRSFQELNKQELQEARDRSQVLSSATRKLENRLKKSQQFTAEQESELLQLKENLASLEEEKDSLTKAKAALESQVQEEQQKLSEAEAELLTLEEKMNRSLVEEESKREEVQNELAASQAAVERLGKDIAEQRQELFSAQTSLARTREEADSLQEDLDEAVEQIASMVNLSESDRTLRSAVRRYQSLETGTVSTPEDADNTLAQFLKSDEIVSLFPGIETLLDTSSLSQ